MEPEKEGDMKEEIEKQLKWFDELPNERTYQSRWQPKLITHEEFKSALTTAYAKGREKGIEECALAVYGFHGLKGDWRNGTLLLNDGWDRDRAIARHLRQLKGAKP